MGSNPFPTMGTNKKVGPYNIERLAIETMFTLRTKRWGKPNLMCNVKVKTLDNRWKNGPTR
jgi:hypothetical protein